MLSYIFDLGAGEASKSVGTVRCCDKTSLAKVIFRLQIPHLGLVRSVYNADRDREDSVTLVLKALAYVVNAARACEAYLCFFSDSLIDDVVILDNLFFHGVRQILQTCVLLLQVDIAKTAVKQYFARV